MEIHLLGAVELFARESSVRLRSDRERCLLASLALDLGRAIGQDDLVDRLWGDDPPDDPLANLYTHVSRLRRVLREAAERDGTRPVPAVRVRAHAYRLEADPEIVDWHRYIRLSAEARAAAGTAPRTLALFEEADGLWTGEALAGLPGNWAQSARVAMAERRMSTLHAGLALRTRLGQFEEVAAEAAELAGRHPLNETLVRHHVVALYAAGRHADALDVFQRARRLFREQLGSEPGESLSRAHTLILRRAPLTDLVPGLPAPSPPPAVAAPVPRNLPRRHQLVGREGELGRLLSAERATGYSGSVITIEAISGMAGVGKSELALHAAYRLGERFPDGQVLVDLRAHSVTLPPLTAEAGLGALLRAFGIPPSAIPQGLQERTALWRAVLTGKRAVIVLDDAQNSEQVAPLLPDDSASLVLITSRNRLTELPSARPMFVDVLPLDDAIGLFRRIVGPERATDTDKIAEIVNRCALLPLAVEIVASRFKARPSWNLGHLLERLSRSPGRLLEIRDGLREVAAAFEMSYNALTAPQRAAFRRLSLLPGPDFGPYAAAAIIGEPLDRTERLIEALLNCHLLQEPRPNRYRFHDLLAEYAAHLAVVEEPPAVRGAAVLRLTEYALRAADRADRLLRPHRSRPALPVPAPAPHIAVPGWADAAAARGWLADELECLLAVEWRTRQDGNAREAAWLAHVLAEFADSEGYWPEAVEMHRAAADHWHRVGDPRAESRALLDLATIHSRASRYTEAAQAAEPALTLARASGDDTVAAEVLNQLGVLHWHVGEYDAAVAILRESLELRSSTGDSWGRSRGLNNLAITYLYMGDHHSALTTFMEALAEVRRIGDPPTEVVMLNNIADLRLRSGDRESARANFAEALELSAGQGSDIHRAVIRVNLAGTLNIPEELNTALNLYHSALAVFRQFGDLRDEASTLNSMGTAFRAASRLMEAKVHHENALRLAREIGAGHDEAAALRGIGDAERALGHLPQARAMLEAAAALAHRIRAPEEEASACDSLAELLCDEGRADEARVLWQRALDIFEPLNEYACDRIRQRLTESEQPGPHWWQREA